MISAGSVRGGLTRRKQRGFVRAGASWILLTIACGNPQPQPSNLSDLEFHSLVYTQAFGQRFGLPAQGVYPLDRGLEAIALRVEIDARQRVRCLLDTYLTDDVAFDYPRGTSGRWSDTSDDGPMFFLDDWSAADGKASQNRWPRGEVFMFRSLVYSEAKKRGGCESGGVDSYARDLLPGLNWLSFEVMCAVLDPANGAAKLWLRRVTAAKTTLSIDHPEDSDADGFAIPQALLLHSADATRKAAKAPVIFGLHGDPPKGKHQQYSLPPRPLN